jgi:hypothetical protein
MANQNHSFFASLKIATYDLSTARVLEVNGKPLFTYHDGRSNSEIENNSTPFMTAKWAFDPILQKPAYPIEKLFNDQIFFKGQYCSDQENVEYYGDILVVQIDGTVCDGASEMPTGST